MLVMRVSMTLRRLLTCCANIPMKCWILRSICCMSCRDKGIVRGLVSEVAGIVEGGDCGLAEPYIYPREGFRRAKESSFMSIGHQSVTVKAAQERRKRSPEKSTQELLFKVSDKSLLFDQSKATH